MSDLISFDFTLDNILSVKAPRHTDPDTLRGSEGQVNKNSRQT